MNHGAPAARLAILATCSGARGPNRLGDDALGHLGGAFLARGSSCVILSRLDLEYSATLAVLERLEARLAAGDPPAEALRRVRSDFSAGGKTSLAQHAALLQAVGLGHASVLAR